MAYKNLPWAVAPARREMVRVGDEETGILELPKLGDLTAGEAATINDLLADQPNLTEEAAKVSEVISAAEGLSLLEAYEVAEKAILGRELTEEQEKIVVNHRAEIERLATLFSRVGRARMAATVTAVIRIRLRLPDFDLIDALALPDKLFMDVYAFAEKEQSRPDADATAAEPMTEADVKSGGEGGGAEAPELGEAVLGTDGVLPDAVQPGDVQ